MSRYINRYTDFGFDAVMIVKITGLSPEEIEPLDGVR